MAKCDTTKGKMAAEPCPRYYHFSAAAERCLCVYGGNLGRKKEPPTTVYFFSCDPEKWLPAATTEGTHPPPNLEHGACTSTEHHVFLQGGCDDGGQYYNTLYQLDCRDLKWTQLSSAGDQGAPIAKRGHKMVYHPQLDGLLLLGGLGPKPTGPTQPGAKYEGDNYVYTNELHIFNLQKGQWSSPAVTGRKPPSCEGFTLTIVDDHRAVLFGGVSRRGGYFKHLYVLDIARMHWSQMDDDKGDPWPEGRQLHAAVCLGFGGDHHQLLITGGYGVGRILSDAWTLDLRSWRWREVKGHSLKPRWSHSATAFTLSQEVTEVIMFGGSLLSKRLVSGTTVLRFEWLEQPTSPTKEWVLTDTATGSQLGTEQRVRKKEEIITSADEKAFLKAIDSLLAKGDKISRNLAHCVITGPTGSGKSSLLLRLLQKLVEKEKFSKSTGVIESMVFVSMNQINPTTFHSATAVDLDVWKEVDYEVSLLSQVGQKSTTPVPLNIQPPPDSSKAQAKPSAEHKPKFKGQRRKRRNDSGTTSLLPSPKRSKEGFVSIIALSSESVLSVVKKCGFKAFREYLKRTSSLYLRDTGGQVEFQEMLPLLIFGPSIFIFVFRADLDFQSKLSFQYRESEGRSLNCYTSSITTEEALLQFLASVYAMDTSGKDVIKTHKSLVFIVGTHIDNLGSSAVERIEQLNQHIDSVIKKNGFHDLVQYADEDKGSIIFPVDNTSDSDQNFSVIRSKVNSLVTYRKEFTIEYPTSFLLFCLDLQKVKKAILSLDDFKVLAARHGIEGQQVFTLLYFLHLRVGVVRYFNVDGLRDVVVLEPQVLFNTITTLIVKTFSCDAVPSREKSEYKKKGLLSTTAFESAISTESNPQLQSSSSSLCVPQTDRVSCDSSEEEMKRGIVPASALESITIDSDLSPKKFLQLLVQLRIIAPFPTAEDQEKYFIPCVLNHVPESSQEDHSHTDVLPLAVKFQCQHCPKGVFGVLVTHLMTSDFGKCVVAFSLLQDKIFKDQVFFTVLSTGDQDTISLKVFSSHLEIKFFPGSLQNRAVPIGMVCQNIREAISISIEKSLVDLHYSREKLEPFTCLSCESCTELHPVFKSGEFHKIHCSETLRSIRLPAQGRCWYNEGEPSPGVGSTGSVTEASGHSHYPEIDTQGHSGVVPQATSHSPPSGHSGAGASGGTTSHPPSSGHSGTGAFGIGQREGQPFVSSYAGVQPSTHPSGQYLQPLQTPWPPNPSARPTGQYLQPMTPWPPNPSARPTGQYLQPMTLACPTGQPWPSAGLQLSLLPHQVSGYHSFYAISCGYPSAPPPQDTFRPHPSVGAGEGSTSDSGAVSYSEINHAKVVAYLKDLSNQEITNIGVRLGLHYARLKRMSCESLMNDMVLAWLRKDDDIGEISGDPSWKTLCRVLKECGHTGIVSAIQRKETLRDLH